MGGGYTCPSPICAIVLPPPQKKILVTPLTAPTPIVHSWCQCRPNDKGYPIADIKNNDKINSLISHFMHVNQDIIDKSSLNLIMLCRDWRNKGKIHIYNFFGQTWRFTFILKWNLIKFIIKNLNCIINWGITYIGIKEDTFFVISIKINKWCKSYIKKYLVVMMMMMVSN